MFEITEDNEIYVTRGDTVFLTVSATEDGETYKFQAGDLLRMKVFEKKACESVVLQKDFPVLEESETVDLILTESETRIGGVISKPVDYWYEVELNPDVSPQTIIGYDEDGAKVFKLFPEGKDLDNDPITEKDVPYVDKELDLSSTRPVQNQAITREIKALATETEKAIAELEKATDELTAEDVGALSSDGGTVNGDILIRRVSGNGNALIAKNHSAVADYGLQLRDDDKDGNTIRLVVSAANQSVSIRGNDGAEKQIFGEHNTDKLNEVIRHHMKDYIDLTQIGLTLGSETIESIATRLPTYSRLYLTVGSTNNAEIYPNGNYGLLIVEKTLNNRVLFTFTNNNADQWHGVYAILSTGNTWTGWKQ